MKNGYAGKKHIVDALFVFALLGLFAVLAVTVVLFGANAYAGNAESYEANYNNRTSLVYIMQKLHSNAEGGNVSIGRIGESDALIITSKEGETVYSTVIYVYENKLKEVVALGGTDVLPTDGQDIMELSEISFLSYTDELLKVTATQPPAATA